MQAIKKKLVLIALLAVMAIVAASVMITANADAASLKWEKDGEQAGVTITEKTNYTEVSGTKDSAVKLKLSGAMDGNDGINFRYLFVGSGDIDYSGTARTDGKNYIKTVIASGDTSIEIISYANYTSAHTASSQVAKMQHDIFYKDPSIKRDSKNNNTKDGVLYLETIETFVAVEGQYHTVDVHKENGMWFFAVDGLSSIPVPSLNDVTLQNATVTFEVFSKTVAPKFRILPVKDGAEREYIQHDFVQFGSDEITQLGDDTVRYRIKDKRAAQYPTAEIRYREQLISAKSFDVRQPINVEFSYDVSNASAVWYAVGLGRPNLYNDITKLQYNVFEYGNTTAANPDLRDDVLSSYSDGIASRNDGIMFQTTTGLAQPTYVGQNNRKEGYRTNSASNPYSGRGNIDLLTFVVKENGTDLYHNGELLFADLVTKLSDFESNGYKAYPYFHFFEDSASVTKGNTIVIKGINSARRTDKNSLKVVGGSNKDLTVGIDDNDNGGITLYDYSGENSQFTAVDSSLYSYNSTEKSLVIKYGYFDGKAYDVYKLYARNNTGSEEIIVRFSDPELSTLPPVPEKTVYYWKEKSGTEDLTVKVDMKNGQFKSISGGGIMGSQWSITGGDGDSTVYTITISKDYLNNKKAGENTFLVKTTNVEEEEFSATFKIIINKSGEEEGGGNGDGDGDGNLSAGCGSNIVGTGMGLAMFLTTITVGAFFIAKKRKKQ